MGTVFGKGSRKGAKPAGRVHRRANADLPEWGKPQEDLRRALVRNGTGASQTGRLRLFGPAVLLGTPTTDTKDSPKTRPSGDNPTQAAWASGTTPPSAAASSAAKVSVTDSADYLQFSLGGRSFSEVFTTESLFDTDQPGVSIYGRQTGLTNESPARSSSSGRAQAARKRAQARRPFVPAPRPNPARPKTAAAASLPRIPANHPAMTALEALGLDGNATWADVQRKYRALAKKAHPDFSGDSGVAMSALNGYYQQLRSAQSYGLFDDVTAPSAT